MEAWEFLIQKAGDRDWLPLPSPESEILEGRYRLMARLAHARCPVEVRVRYLDIDTTPPRRKLLRRRDRTDANGLVALLPFTMLQSGMWSIQCAVKSGEGEIRVHALQIQVLEQVADGDVDFDVEPDAEDVAFLEALQSAPTLVPSSEAAPVSAAEPVAVSPDAAPQALNPRDRPNDATQAETEAQRLAQQLLEDLMQSVRSPVDPIGTAATGGAIAAKPSDQSANASPADGPALDFLTEIPPDAQADTQPEIPLEILPSIRQDMQPETQPEIQPEIQPGVQLDHQPDLQPASQADPSLVLSSEAPNPFELAAAHLEALEAVDLEAIDPEALHEINRLFQTAEELAEHIIASMAKKFDELAAVLDESAALEAGVGENFVEPFAAPTPNQVNASPSPIASPGQSAAVTPANVNLPGEALDESLEELSDAFSAAEAASPDERFLPLNPESLVGTIHISIERDAYVLHRHQPFTVAGQLEAIAPDQPSRPLDAKLRLCLTDPQTGRRLLVQDQVMRISRLPHRFTCAIAQPALPKTHLLLGQLLLIDGRATVEDDDTVWASQSFVVTTDLSDLLDTVAQGTPQFEVQPPPEFLPPQEQAASPSARVTIPEIRPSSGPQPAFRPAENQPLPPRLTPAGAAAPRTKIELPPFGKGSATASSGVAIALADAVRAAQAAPASPPADSVPADTVSLADAGDADAGRGDSANPPQPPPQSHGVGEAAPAVTDVTADKESPAGDVADTGAPNRPQPAAGKMAAHPPGGEAATSAPEAVQPAAPAPEDLALRHRPLAGQPSPVAHGETSSQEVVVDDGVEAVAEDGGQVGDRSLQHPSASANSSYLPGLTLPEDVPIPTPDLGLPTGELVAGEMVTVVVRLPEQAARIYVKLWVYDRQTRSMAIPPRWLVNFYPDGLGCLKTTAKLPVPQGCLEMVVEAIAVEMLTQRESRKVSLARPVVPADLPSLTLDDASIV
ncbi:MAG: hypothetical protein VKK04_00405 [Synechococcales bacterium]|nr:hypothetical protein [Synechococcales bacterium]